MKLNRKVLITTRYLERKRYSDITAKYMRRVLKTGSPLRISYGLRFIKQNIPEIEILEYPSWEEYEEKLREGWDVVGFSFYTYEIPEILRMVRYARSMGIKELWAGNYGALTEGIEKYFDKIFIGYAEEEIAKELGRKIERIIHPPLIEYRTFGRVKTFVAGRLFTSRGCNFRCIFCQTPSFCKKPSTIPIESIENVLRYYRALGVREIFIDDENFGLFPSHSEKVITLLNEYHFYWRCMIRPDFLAKRLEAWSKRGLVGVSMGIENFNQGLLDSIGKHIEIKETVGVIKELQKMNKSIVGFYIIGFKNETEESIREDIKKLEKLGLDLTGVYVLTPFPKTALWNEIEREYGIFEKDWPRYDLAHLVWNHPYITPKQMESLLDWALRYVHPNRGFLRTTTKTIKNYGAEEGKFLGGWRYLWNSMLRANRFNYFPAKPRFLHHE